MTDRQDTAMTHPDTARTEAGGRQDATPEGLTVAEAAIRLAVTPDAIRRRLYRGTLAGAKTVDGERERFDMLHREALARIPALGAGQDVSRAAPAVHHATEEVEAAPPISVHSGNRVPPLGRQPAAQRRPQGSSGSRGGGSGGSGGSDPSLWVS